MQQVKFFKSVEAEVSEMEREINAWLADLQKKGGKLLNVQGNIAPQTIGNPGSSTSRYSPSDLFVIATYETE